ncbi:DUF951 domain-containing protein [Aerococcus suis]|uniref:DUF951 domain-containing protein n=1 Tax=Aerococcus suis TaxID=371602 RepID=A0A1W1ZDA5_9LACT|nr:DUF951 domain-containing protein [Aerococcus suis]MCI7240122.1 DUF951 domain-containing protein [Aerococcus suis]MDD7758488.1 DUF951 domain-containing protein [Aerococcus suis]MDY4647325.1 DUF951 domain-containing protein [Aerococcus suis]SMC46435.1 hypothetical protein SAMN04487984_1283 [Aerococcus suis]
MAKDKNYELHDVVEMKKPHPCGNNAWRVIRMGADIRIKCQGCGQSVLMPRREFEKKMNTRLEKASETE